MYPYDDGVHAAPMRVPLHDLHASLGARFVEFAGFEMPVQYSGIMKEHEAVRTAAGLFDVSHMSNLWIEGPGAQDLLSKTLAADPARVKEGRGQYTVACKEDGTIIDDLIFYHVGPQRYHVIPNAGMNEAFVEWFGRHAGGDVRVEDFSRRLCILALQGPKAREILKGAYPELAGVKRFGVKQWDASAGHCLVSGTGYTGEDGVELIVPNSAAPSCWRHLMDIGADAGLVPSGLGARDTLRLEKGYCLAPHEFKGGRTPLEAGLEWVVHWDHDFIGRQALKAQKEEGSHDRLVGLKATGRGIPREGCVVRRDGADVGVVTSGTMSPSLKQAIALAYVSPDAADVGTMVDVDVRGRDVGAEVVKPPFA